MRDRDLTAKRRSGVLAFLRPGRATVLGVFTGLPVAAAGLLAVSYASFAALPPVPQPAENPITESKRVLGKILFWDEQLSSSNVVSCGTCHVPANGGNDNRIARHAGDDNVLNTPDDILGSPGVISSDKDNNYVRDAIFALRPQITGRAANSMINAAYAPELFWDGRAHSQFIDPQSGQVAINTGGALESQAVQPPASSIEMAHMDINWEALTAKLARVKPLNLATNLPPDTAAAIAARPTYADLFTAAFGDGAITATRVAFAIATYQRTLIADQTPWDRFDAGQANALTPQQQRGLNAFNGPGRCNLCHTAPLFTDQTYRNIGLRPTTEDPGRQEVTGNFNDRGKFKVPSLRNAGLKLTYMHNGQLATLNNVLAFYARGTGAPPQFADNRDPILPQINTPQNPLPPNVAADIAEFIRGGLTDPRVAASQFPFDRPTLFVDRPNDRATLLGGGTAGSGGIVPTIIVQAPSMIGNTEYRIGLDGALGGASVRLGISTAPPVAGRIVPTRWFDAMPAMGSGNGQGIATLHWPLTPAQVSAGQVYYAQWFIADPGAAGGQAVSGAARIPMFCGSTGCPSLCDMADLDQSGYVDDADFTSFAAAYEEFVATSTTRPADFTGDGRIDDSDFVWFSMAYEQFACE